MGAVAALERWWRGRIPGGPERDAMAALARGAAAVFSSAVAPERRGLFLVSANAGFSSALTFWRGVARDGAGFASPALFPWTLSNAPCGWLAREFGIRGPNVTHTGRAGALGAALHQCRRHLSDDEIDAGWIVAVDFGTDPGRLTVSAVVHLVREARGSNVEHRPSAGEPSKQRASAILHAVLRDCERHGAGAFRDDDGEWQFRAAAASRSSRRGPATRPIHP